MSEFSVLSLQAGDVIRNVARSDGLTSSLCRDGAIFPNTRADDHLIRGVFFASCDVFATVVMECHKQTRATKVGTKGPLLLPPGAYVERDGVKVYPEAAK